MTSAAAALFVLSFSASTEAAGLDEFVSAAKKEGELTVIALPRDWCGYGALIDSFKAKYGISVNELNPDGGSGDEIEAIKANKNNKGPQAPDVIDVGLSFGPAAKAEGLLLPYKVATWDTIPAEAKDPEGYWTGDYYGVLSFAVNDDLVKTPPTDWSDLLKPEFKSSVALAGDPRASNQATMGRLRRRPRRRRDRRRQGRRGRPQVFR
jgi:putative spermidine/putrescine transport system substrate-binding protein